ncbi:cyanamide hydratase protein [Rutstroemia sp. NJR-2017a BBW]|nr:cyanamide hydratase protein [Rutstroemia sp. NJR-2017a BBW]
MNLKLTYLVQLLVAFHTPPSLSFQHVLPRNINHHPTRVLGGVTVIDTPLIRAAQALARQSSAGYLYNHIMRTWLFGALLLNHNLTLTHTIDLEVHALGSLLHDLGLVLNATWISPDRRFEVDSAFAATDFVELHAHNSSSGWDAHRLQLLFDSILLSSEPKFALYKEPTVAAVVGGVLIDLQGAGDAITEEEYEGVVEAFPKGDFLSGVNRTLVELCVAKPNSTYGQWMFLLCLCMHDTDV